MIFRGKEIGILDFLFQILQFSRLRSFAAIMDFPG